MTRPPVLITSASLDAHAFEPVSKHVQQLGYPTIVYQTDRVLDHQDRFNLSVGADGSLGVTYNGVSIAPDDIGSAWYRKLTNFDHTETKNDLAKQLHLNNELRHFHDAIWTLYPDEIWVNSPRAIKAADQKLGQLLVAQSLGFSIPQTILGNSWEFIDKELTDASSNEIIAKTIRGVISEMGQVKAMYTQVLNFEEIEKIKDNVSPVLGLFQPKIQKAREWRVTVVEENVFPVAIYTDEGAKDDWRKHQTTSSVTFVSETIANEVSARCIAYLGAMSLRYGAFDLIETPEGEIIFLECNPNGQYGWLETSLDLPISQTIAQSLVNIASSRL